MLTNNNDGHCLFRTAFTATYCRPHSPTIPEFVQYLIDFSNENGAINLNRHFAPQYTLCPFCFIDFDVIGHLEEAKVDFKVLAEYFGAVSLPKIR